MKRTRTKFFVASEYRRLPSSNVHLQVSGLQVRLGMINWEQKAMRKVPRSKTKIDEQMKSPFQAIADETIRLCCLLQKDKWTALEWSNAFFYILLQNI